MGEKRGATEAEVQRGIMGRVAVASFMGSLIEFYDLLLFSLAAALVFSAVYYPSLGDAAGTAASFATLGVALVARPLGSIIFGHFGDRFGRKKTLVVTLLMMGAATVLVGLVPTSEQIGVAAPILLVLLRIVQGLAAGGEWAGAVNFAAEYAPNEKRGLWTMFPMLGGGVAVALAPAVFALTSASMSDEAFLSYGWRIPFLLSAVLIAVGLYIRLAIDETPVFERAQDEGKSSRVPFVDAWLNQPRQILLGIGAVISMSTMSYMGVAYLPNYATNELGLSRTTVLTMGIAAGVFYSIAIAISGAAADLIGRRRMLLGANGLAVIWALALFQLMGTGNAVTFGLSLGITLFIAGLALGPLGAALSELFDTRYRYTASGFSYSAAQIVGGAIPPFVAAPIIASVGVTVFSMFITGLCLISLLSIMLMRDSGGIDLQNVGN